MTTLPASLPSSPTSRFADSLANSPTFRSLRHRNFKLFLGGQLISQTGAWLTMVTQTLLVLSLTGSGLTLGLLMAAQFGPVLILGAWAGAVVDRADKRTLLMKVQTLGMVQSFALGVVVLAGWGSIPAIFALASVQGILTAFDNPARRAFVVEMVPPEDLPNAVSLNSAVMTGARVVGPAAAGALILAVGYGWPFIIDSFSFLGVLAGLWMMRPGDLYRPDPTPKGKGQVRQGLRYIRSQRSLFVPLVMMGIVGLFAFNFSVTIPLFVSGPMHGGTTAFTLLFSVLSIGSVTGALLTARRTEVTPRQLVLSAGAFGAALVLLAAAPNLALAFPAALVLGWASITFMTSITAIVQVLAGSEYRGRVLAIQGMVFLGATPFGGPMLGWVADAGGPRAGLLLGALACAVAAVFGAKALDVDLSRPQAVDPTITGEYEAISLAD